MRQFALPAISIVHDSVVYATATPASGLSFAANTYYLLVGDNVPKYRQNEILGAAEWLEDIGSARFYTVGFPAPADIGATFLRQRITTALNDPKAEPTLVSIADIGTMPVLSEDNIYFGYTGGTAAAFPVNRAKAMASRGLESALDEITHFYLASAVASQ